jgi:hypothetical protein
MGRVAGVLAAVLVAAFITAPAGADIMAYGRVVTLEAEGDTFLVRHWHDWSGKTRGSRGRMMATHRDPFRVDNDYAHVEWRARDGGKRLRQMPSPALTWLGVTPDQRYVVGLSSIKHVNPYQLAVWDREGNLLLKRRIAGAQPPLVPDVMQSVTNFVHWFDAKDPSPREIEESGRPVALELRGRTGKTLSIPFESDEP